MQCPARHSSNYRSHRNQSSSSKNSHCVFPFSLKQWANNSIGFFWSKQNFPLNETTARSITYTVRPQVYDLARMLPREQTLIFTNSDQTGLEAGLCGQLFRLRAVLHASFALQSVRMFKGDESSSWPSNGTRSALLTTPLALY